MFTGIIQELGKVKELKRQKGIPRLSIASIELSKDANIGDSISVNGVCLTVVSSKKDELAFDVMDETLAKTNLGRLRRGDAVNLEPPLKLGDRLNGHILSGHIDGTGVIKSVVNRSNACEIRIGFPIRLKKYIVPKGSVALDGVSLTVAEVGQDWFLAHIIPHTLSSTRLGCVKVGDAVNMESDLMAKYAESNVSGDRGISEDFLKEKGFI